MGLLFDIFEKSISNVNQNNKINLNDYDWIDTNPDNGKIYYGKDDGEGRTDWYDEDGNLDSSTETPEDDDEYLEKIEHY